MNERVRRDNELRLVRQVLYHIIRLQQAAGSAGGNVLEKAWKKLILWPKRACSCMAALVRHQLDYRRDSEPNAEARLGIEYVPRSGAFDVLRVLRTCEDSEQRFEEQYLTFLYVYETGCASARASRARRAQLEKSSG